MQCTTKIPFDMSATLLLLAPFYRPQACPEGRTEDKFRKYSFRFSCTSGLTVGSFEEWLSKNVVDNDSENLWF